MLAPRVSFTFEVVPVDALQVIIERSGVSWHPIIEREALRHGPHPGRRDRVEPLARPTRVRGGTQSMALATPHPLVGYVPLGLPEGTW
jgi:hypothetical protein